MEKVWQLEYPAGTPTEINPDSYASLVAMYDEACQKYHDRPAFRCHGCDINFGKLHELSLRFAAFLQHDLKLEPGDRFAIKLPNLLQYPVVLFGALQAGLVIVNLNPLYTTRELEEILVDAKPRAIVTLENFAYQLSEISAFKVDHVIITAVGDLYPFVKKHLINFVVRFVKRAVPKWHLARFHWLGEVLEQAKELPHTSVNLNGNTLAFLQYTGGTTGHPKGVMLSHRNLIANLLQLQVFIDQDLQPSGEVMITALPLYHIFSLQANLFLFTVFGGLNILIPNPRDFKDFIHTLKKTKFTAITGVNTLFDTLLHHPDFYKVDFSNLRISIAGGMSLQQKVAEQWQELTNSTIVEGYGLSESSPVLTLNPLSNKGYNGSIGIPLPSTELRICDEGGTALNAREIGEIWAKGPQVMQGYWQNELATAQTLTKDGWLKTGDIAYFDEKGYFYIIDRLKDIIVVSGFNVYPAEVENVIMELPAVREVAAIGVSAEDGGEVIKSYIVLNEGMSLTESEVKDHCRKQLTAYKQPRIIEFIDELPKTVIGKVLRRALRR